MFATVRARGADNNVRKEECRNGATSPHARGVNSTRANRGAAQEASIARDSRDPPNGGSVAGWTQMAGDCPGMYEYRDGEATGIHARGAIATTVDRDAARRTLATRDSRDASNGGFTVGETREAYDYFGMGKYGEGGTSPHDCGVM